MFVGRSISTTLLPCFHTCLCLWLSVSMNETSGFPTASASLKQMLLTTPESGDHRRIQSPIFVLTPGQETDVSRLQSKSPAIADGIVDGGISLPVSSKGELNHRPDLWVDDGANDWLNNSWLVDHPGSDSRTDIGAAHTALLAVGEAIGTTAEAIGFALNAAVG